MTFIEEITNYLRTLLESMNNDIKSLYKYVAELRQEIGELKIALKETRCGNCRAKSGWMCEVAKKPYLEIDKCGETELCKSELANTEL